MRGDPIAATHTWRAVMAAAGRRCQCTGQCGRPHTSGQGRCPAEHQSRVRLHAAPADPAVPPDRAARLPADLLHAWCEPCHDGARHTAARASRRAPDPSQDALFDLSREDT